MNEEPLIKNKLPWHLFLISLLFIFLYSIGLYDYIQVHNNNVEYMNSLKVKGDIVGYFSNYPLLFTMLWTINVCTGLIAAIMLLFKTKWVVWVLWW